MPQREWSQIISFPKGELSTLINCDLELASGFPGGSDSKESVCSAGDLGSIPGSEDPLKKGMATHSSILAWRNQRTEEPRGLQSRRSQRVGQD